jgi:hypothetical protein
MNSVPTATREGTLVEELVKKLVKKTCRRKMRPKILDNSMPWKRGSAKLCREICQAV